MYLCLVKKIGEEFNGNRRYEFLFSSDKNIEFTDEDYFPVGLSNDFDLPNEYVTKVKILNTKINFDLIQDNQCFSFSHAKQGIVAVAYENIDTYDKYPEEGRLYFMFGDSLEEVEERLAKKNLLFVNTLNIEL